MKAGLHLRADMDDGNSDSFSDSPPALVEISSDEEVSAKKHKALIKSAAAAYGKKIQRIQAPHRNEPSFEVSEFHLSDKRRKVKKLAKTLAGSLEKVGKHSHVAQKVKKVQSSSKPLPAPLERPEAEKIQRSVAYDNTKNLLNRWEPVVTTNKVTPELHFPLNTPYFRLSSTKDFIANYKPKSKLEEEVDKILSGLPEKTEEKERQEPKRTFFLNRKEILQQRREMARIRAQQSYREAKARRQNKIKSKRYHRILRREKTKKQLQEFEKLQKTDPEAALKKLEELEKTRAEERVSLRHRSTGQWARNKAVHAKYDKEARQQLHQQLRMSRDLTTKVVKEESSESEDDVVEDHPVSEENPWIKRAQDYEKFVTKYQKYLANEDWSSREASIAQLRAKAGMSESVNATSKNKRKAEMKEPQKKVETSKKNARENDSESSKSTKRIKQKPETSNKPIELVIYNGFQVTDVNVKIFGDLGLKKSFNSDWKCTPIESPTEIEEVKLNKDVDDMFEAMENKIMKKVEKRLSEINCQQDGKTTKKKIKKSVEKKDRSIGVQVKGESSQEAINDETSQVPTSKNNTDSSRSWELGQDGMTLNLPKNGKFKKFISVESKPKGYSLEINPSKFVRIGEREFRVTKIPDVIVNEEDNSPATEEEKRMTIAEAFTDDDVVAEFQQEKEAVAEKDKPKDIDLTLPGWGEWAGKGIENSSNRKKKRFVIKAPKNIPRKDDKKDSVIINEKSDAKARSHQVNELPHPYVGVETFERSIRAPLGSTWVPETAHRKFISPKIKTMLGTVIEPLSEDVLLDDEDELERYDETNPVYQVD